MRRQQGTPEKNTGKSLTIPVRTMNPLEAYNMLNMGHPIDQAVGYYEEMGIVNPDFYMMDRIGKLKQLQHYKEIALSHKTDIDKVVNEAKQQEEERIFNEAVEREIAKRSVTKSFTDNEQAQQQVP